MFSEVIAFDQARLMRSFVNPWFCDAVRSVFVLGRKSVGGTLHGHHLFGSHSGLVVFTAAATATYTWSHPVRQPFGVPHSPQCPKCMRVGSLKKQRLTQHINRKQVAVDWGTAHYIVCSKSPCDYSRLFTFPEGASWLDGRHPTDDASGGWIKTVVKS